MNRLNVLLILAFIFHQIPEGYSKELYQLNINERGTLFNESIEIDDLEKTVVYKVPSHNEIRKTDVLVDYKNGHFVTKIPEREECYIKPFPIADEQSIRETKQNLELVQRIKSLSPNATIPVETITIRMKAIRKIPREELSEKVLDFCGENTAYEVEEKIVSSKKGKSIAKRSGPVRNTVYRLNIHKSSTSQELKAAMPNGYLTCKKVKDHNEALFSCLRKGRTPLVGCGLYPRTCRYQAICEMLPAGEERIPSTGSVGTRDHEGLPKFNFVDIKCVEQHKFTVDWCCDVLPCN